MEKSFLDWLCEKWPQIRLIASSQTVSMERLRRDGVNGYCTHPDAADGYWVHSRGGKKFTMDPSPPECFCWLVTQYRGGSEYLFVMWYRGGRRFWFYDRFVVFVAQTNASVARTSDRLDSVIRLWETCSHDVIFSGPWGWFDSHTRRFQRDPVADSFPEDWEHPDDITLVNVHRLFASLKCVKEPCKEPKDGDESRGSSLSAGGESPPLPHARRRWWQFWK
jgi:hypothetical protein